MEGSPTDNAVSFAREAANAGIEGYHAVTMGFLAAEIVKRVDGRSLGAFFAQEIARPLELEFWIGLPEEHDARAARIIQYRSSGSATGW